MDCMGRTIAAGRLAAAVWRAGLGLALALAAALPAVGMGREVDYGAPPAWVRPTPVPLDPPAATGAAVGGVQWLLVDHQTRLDGRDGVAYTHYAKRALDGDGVEDAAHVHMSFDPAYQTLALHSITVIRAGRRIPRLDPAAVHVLQREKDLEARLYDGRKTANVLLEDVRVGDIVDYEYSVRGVNPAFADHGFGSYDLQWKVPVQSLRERLLVREGRDLRLQPYRTALQPEVQRHDGWVDYTWSVQSVPALALDGDEPPWYDPYPVVQWSDFPDWASVAAWAVPLYRVADDQGPELRARVDAIARASKDPSERVLAVLRLVQGEVRYLGIEVGVGSFAPRPPRTVMAKRFGDCKDKALLTAWMLRALGIDARPALVNSRMTRAIEHFQPSPGAFDHVVVRATLGSDTVWLDPTRALQKGDLPRLTQADFGLALVVDEATTALQPMLDRSLIERRREVHTVFDASGGRGKPVTMVVSTLFQGAEADRMRGVLAGESHEELQRDYLNFYADDYADVTLDKPFTVSDDEHRNRLTVTEYYRLGDLWKRSDEKKRFAARFYSPEIESAMYVPDRTVRSGPLGLRYPLIVDSITDIRLHKDWRLDIRPTIVDDPAFHYRGDVTTEGAVVTMAERFEVLADNVPSDRVAAYAAQLKKARRSLGLNLYLPDAAAPASDAQGWSAVPIHVLCELLLTAVVVAWMFYRRRGGVPANYLWVNMGWTLFLLFSAREHGPGPGGGWGMAVVLGVIAACVLGVLRAERVAARFAERPPQPGGPAATSAIPATAAAAEPTGGAG